MEAISNYDSSKTELGRDKVRVSHLQHADDMVFVSSGKESNSWAMKWILKNFELLTGLIVNFQKCSIMGINIERDLLEEMARYLGCSIGLVPFSFFRNQGVLDKK